MFLWGVGGWGVVMRRPCSLWETAVACAMLPVSGESLERLVEGTAPPGLPLAPSPHSPLTSVATVCLTAFWVKACTSACSCGLNPAASALLPGTSEQTQVKLWVGKAFEATVLEAKGSWGFWMT